MKMPKWTVLYNTYSTEDIISRNKAFFKTKTKALEYYKVLHNMDKTIERIQNSPLFCPACRPYNHKSDFIWLVN
jgi:hypothetical protein